MWEVSSKFANMSGLHEVQTGSGKLAGKIAIITGTRTYIHSILYSRSSSVRVIRPTLT